MGYRYRDGNDNNFGILWEDEMSRHGLFGKPDRRGWFDYEKCPACGTHWRLCDCSREKSDIEKIAEVGSQADIITPIAAYTGVSPGCLIILCILGAALIVVWGNQ